MRKLTLVAALAAVLALATASVAAAHPFDRDDGGWRTYVLASGAAIEVPAPPRNSSSADARRARDARGRSGQRARPAPPSRRRSPNGTPNRRSRRGRRRPSR